MAGEIILTTGGQSRLLRGKVPLLQTWRLAVFANNVTLTRNTKLADLELADARFRVGGLVAPLTTPQWPTPPFVNAEGLSVMTSGLIDVVPAPLVVSITFYGWCLISDDNYLMMGARLTPPLPIVVDRGIPATAFLFRINFAEDSIL